LSISLRWGKICFILLLREFIYRSTALETKSVSRKPILIWLIVSQLLAAASLIFWLVVAGLSVMAFDSGVTSEAWTFVIAVWSYPIWPIAFAIAAWIAYARKKDRLAGVLTTLTFLPVLALMAFLALSSFFFSLGL
jgi:K+-sensing histidine kinase KdpD